MKQHALHGEVSALKAASEWRLRAYEYCSPSGRVGFAGIEELGPMEQLKDVAFFTSNAKDAVSSFPS